MRSPPPLAVGAAARLARWAAAAATAATTLLLLRPACVRRRACVLRSLARPFHDHGQQTDGRPTRPGPDRGRMRGGGAESLEGRKEGAVVVTVAAALTPAAVKEERGSRGKRRERREERRGEREKRRGRKREAVGGRVSPSKKRRRRFYCIQRGRERERERDGARTRRPPVAVAPLLAAPALLPPSVCLSVRR